MAQEYAKGFYNSSAWLKCRASFLKSRMGLCEKCGGIGSIVHHRVHITPTNFTDPLIVLSWDNLQLLCLTCHNVSHGRTAPCIEGLRFDAQGNLVKL